MAINVTIYEVLSAVNAYPVPHSVLSAVCVRRGINADEQYTQAIAASASFMLAVADVKQWLVNAPNVSQGGVNYTLSDTDRIRLKHEADVVLEAYDSTSVKPAYGYKGDTL